MYPRLLLKKKHTRQDSSRSFFSLNNSRRCSLQQPVFNAKGLSSYFKRNRGNISKGT